jgi:hypothetical protein
MPQYRCKFGCSFLEINIEAWVLERKSPKVKRVQDDGLSNIDYLKSNDGRVLSYFPRKAAIVVPALILSGSVLRCSTRSPLRPAASLVAGAKSAVASTVADHAP